MVDNKYFAVCTHRWVSRNLSIWFMYHLNSHMFCFPNCVLFFWFMIKFFSFTKYGRREWMEHARRGYIKCISHTCNGRQILSTLLTNVSLHVTNRMSPCHNSTPQSLLERLTACCHSFIIIYTITLAVIFHVGDSHWCLFLGIWFIFLSSV